MLSITPSMLEILVAISAGPIHGYALMSAVARINPKGKKLAPGTLYTNLQRLLDAGLVKCVPDADPRRKVYEITPTGRLQMRAALDLQRTFLSRADAWLGGQS